MNIVISSGHGLKIRGASGLIDEVNEARRVVEKVAEYLRQLGVGVDVFHDNTSTTQNTNLRTIKDYHNSKARDLDISVHFNALSKTDAPRGTEVFYYSGSAAGKAKAQAVSQAIATAGGLVNRGAKSNSLFFTRETAKTAILIEVCFVDSSADVAKYNANFDAICKAIAESVAEKKLAQPDPVVAAAPSVPAPQEPIEEGPEVFNPSNQALRDAVSIILMRLSDPAMHGTAAIDTSWRDKFNAGELSTSDGLALLYLSMYRGSFDLRDGSDK